MRHYVIALMTALSLSVLGAVAVWAMTQNTGKALTAGGIGLVIGLVIFLINSVGAGKEAR